MSRRFVDNRFQQVDAAGSPIVGSLGFYLTGTTTPITTYSNKECTTANANPLQADSNGRFGPIWFKAATLAAGVKCVFLDGDDTVVFTDDPISYDQLADLLLYPQTAAEAAAGYTPASLQYPAGDLRRYGAPMDGSTDHYVYFGVANLYADFILVDGGTARISTNTTVWKNVYFGPSGFISIDSGRTFRCYNTTASATTDVVNATAGKVTGSGTFLTVRGQASGPGSTAVGTHAVAIGIPATADGDYSVAIGDNNADGLESVAIGKDCVVKGTQNVAIGVAAEAGNLAAGATVLTAAQLAGASSMPVASIAGFVDTAPVRVHMTSGRWHDTTINGVPAGLTIVLLDALPEPAANGAQVVSENAASVAIGVGAHAPYSHAVAIGHDAHADTDRSVAVGNNASAEGLISIAIGNDSQVTGSAGIAIGQSAAVTGANSQNFGASEIVSAASHTRVGLAGNMLILGVRETAVVDANIPNNAVAIWADLSGGTKYLRFRHRDNGGTIRAGTVTIA